MFDLIVRNGTLVTPGCEIKADLAIEAGTIREIGPELSGAASGILDASGLHILPALIDVHLHFNEPGRTEWEGAGTGSRALAAGGGAVFFDMPLNSTPCTVNAGEFDRKCAALAASSVADFGLWGGLIPGNLSNMEELAERGAVGFKAFMCDSGLPEFPRADDLTLYEGMREAARLDLPVAVHAESEELTRKSRPVIAELEAIQRAALFARDTGARLHIVHISSGRGVVAALEARAQGTDISIETCPHYLYFTEADVERLGALLKCAPPLRSPAQQDALWEHVRQGTVDIIASDHSPAPPSMKTADFKSAWGGIAGVQSTLSVLLDRQLPLARIAELLSATPARRFRIAGKGSLAVGHDADLVLVELNASFTLRKEAHASRHGLSPYTGSTFRGIVRQTLRRGEVIFRDGQFPAQSCGSLIRPGKG